MSKKTSLADKISGLLNTAPSYNPDEQNDPESTAKVVDYEEDEVSEGEEQILSKFRKQNADLLEDVDIKYAGKKSSRRNLRDDDDSDSDLQSEDHEDEDGEDAIEDDESQGQEEIGSNEEETEYESDGSDILDESADNFKHINESNAKAINKKSSSVQNQIQMWESLLEMRIQVQKCLVASNKLPPTEIYKEMKQDSQFKEKTDTLKKTLGNTLSNMLELQQLLVKKFPESKDVLKDKPSKTSDKSEDNEKEDDEDDEEIPSDTEDEDGTADNDDDVEDNEEPKAKKKKMSNADYENEISTIHKKYKTFRNGVIQKWNDKTHIAQGKNTNVTSVLNQIEYNLSDKSKLVKRTQLKRSEYRILGCEETTETDETEGSTNNHEYNTNIFDDDDFYHQLLRELIEVKSADITDPIQLSRQWIQLQNLRSKMKRKIDTRATKGRKIRYGIHTKLVNFMAPILTETISDEAQSELFQSLFGNKT